MTHLSLCSGIGGLDLAIGTPTTFAENDPAPSEVLAHHFPNVPNIGDWTRLDNFNGYDLISGGLPCQPLSGAGKGKGDADERYLFDDFIRILRSSDVRPTIVFENVRGILYPRNAKAFWRLISALADLGYVGQWEVVRASDIGAPHRRERWFCVARSSDARHANGERAHRAGSRSAGRGEPEDAGGSAAAATLRQSKYGPAVRRWELLTRPCPPPLDDRGRLDVEFVTWMMGYPEGYVSMLPRTKALKALGNAVVPQQARLALDILT